MPELVPGANGGKMNRFLPGESGNPAGRPKQLMSTIVADLKKAGYERVSAAEILEVTELLMNLPTEELREIQNDKAKPLSIRVVAGSMLSKKNGFNVLQTMLDRAHGKSKQQLDLTGSGIVVPTVTVVVQPPAEKK